MAHAILGSVAPELLSSCPSAGRRSSSRRHAHVHVHQLKFCLTPCPLQGVHRPPLSACSPQRLSVQPTAVMDSASIRSSTEALLKNHVPLYVMLPYDTVSATNTLNHVKALQAGLRALKIIGVDGVMVHVWWGVVEGKGPNEYDWSAYKDLVEIIAGAGLKVQASMCFHAQQGDRDVPLPPWVESIGDENPDIFHADRSGSRQSNALSLAIDSLNLLKGRTPLKVYRDFLESFHQTFHSYLGSNIVEIVMGLGPNGELRYPAHPEEANGKWSFPGVGEFQCYDKYMLEDLKNHAVLMGEPKWGLGGPHDAPCYNDFPNDAGFSNEDNGSWRTPYGDFFLSWYSGLLVKHADKMLSMAASVFEGERVVIAGRVAAVHWCYKSESHAAEIAAGFYNAGQRDGYDDIARVFKKNSAVMILPCMEMSDVEQPSDARGSPELLLLQMRRACVKHGVAVTGENSLPRFDNAAQMKMKSGIHRSEPLGLPRLAAFSFSRMGESLFEPQHWRQFVNFAWNLDTDNTSVIAEQGESDDRIPAKVEDRMTIGSQQLQKEAAFQMQ